MPAYLYIVQVALLTHWAYSSDILDHDFTGITGEIHHILVITNGCARQRLCLGISNPNPRLPKEDRPKLRDTHGLPSSLSAVICGISLRNRSGA